MLLGACGEMKRQVSAPLRVLESVAELGIGQRTFGLNRREKFFKLGSALRIEAGCGGHRTQAMVRGSNLQAHHSSIFLALGDIGPPFRAC